jgi:iron(III) transport system ATP-binding protein
VAEPIVIERLGKTYPGGNEALTDVSFEVEPGAFLVLLGPSGSGKTTLLRCLAGIERTTTGRIAIGSRTVADGRSHVPPDQRDLSMVFQDYALWPHLSALDNVAFALRRRRLSSADRAGKAKAMLDRVGLSALAARYPNELSGGEQQRVALARALVADTGLILCDEPLSNLDADLRERMRVEISTLVRDAGATTVYITHDQAEAFALADMVGVLEKGRLVQFGTPEEIYKNPATPFVARFTGLSGEIAVTAGAAEPVLMIRPSGVEICALGEHDLSGVVTDVAFRVRGYEHAIELPGRTRLTGVFSARRAQRGETVGLKLDPAGCHVFPAGSVDLAQVLSSERTSSNSTAQPILANLNID